MNDRKLEQARERIFRRGETVPLREGQTETFTATYRPSGGALREARVDHASGRLSDVPFLGRVSRNQRRYTDQALADAARLYEGVQLYLDHPTDRELRDRDGIRSVRDLIGRAENVRKAGDVVKGSVVLLEVEPARSLVLSLAETAPELAGFSHRATGTVRADEDGTQIVESLEQVFALELVTEPATVGGLMEQVRRRGEGDGGRGPRPVTGRVVEESRWKLFS